MRFCQVSCGFRNNALRISFFFSSSKEKGRYCPVICLLTIRYTSPQISCSNLLQRLFHAFRFAFQMRFFSFRFRFLYESAMICAAFRVAARNLISRPLAVWQSLLFPSISCDHQYSFYYVCYRGGCEIFLFF